jgi:hypothetical protein
MISSNRRRRVGPAALFLSGLLPTSQAIGACGEVVTLATRGETTMAYSLAMPAAREVQEEGVALVLLAGGAGFLDIDARGCPRRLKGNSLVRKRDLFHEAGFATALVDAPSNYRGADGLGGYRLAPQHAEDIGKVIADVRERTKMPVWLIGTSRGAISAANAAGRLKGAQAPDGLVLTSPVTSGRKGGRKTWVAQTVFGAPLEAIRIPVLAVAHAADTCIRTPPERIGQIAARTNGSREQAVAVSGGLGGKGGPPSVEACRGNTPHGFIGQDAEVTAGMIRFIRGGAY